MARRSAPVQGVVGAGLACKERAQKRWAALVRGEDVRVTIFFSDLL